MRRKYVGHVHNFLRQQSMGTLNRVCANVPPTDFACLGGKAEFALQSYVGGSPGLIAALANL